MKKPSLSATLLPCLCANVRRTARALTQLYDEALRPLGLRATQFTVLQALALAGEISQGNLGELLVMDSTSLTRTLRLLRAHQWVSLRRGKDRRERLLSLSAAGRRTLKRALPVWERVQERLRKNLGDSRWEELEKLSTELVKAVSVSDKD